MRLDELSDVIHDVLSTILNSQDVLAVVPIIRRYDNGPRPTPPYLAFNPNPNVREIGKVVTIGSTDADPEKHVQTYEVSVDVHEIGSDGQYLQLIQQLQYSRPIKDFLYTKMVVIPRVGSIVPLPKLLDDDIWEKESVLELIINFTHVNEETTTYITTVELNNNIGD